MFGLDAPELIIIAVVVLILFGSRKLPDAARSLGRSLRIFKAETRGMKADEQAAAIEAAQPAEANPTPAAEIPVAPPLPPGSSTTVSGQQEPATPVTEPHAGSESR
jgi:sec-independent protein translocase protein TatA